MCRVRLTEAVALLVGCGYAMPPELLADPAADPAAPEPAQASPSVEPPAQVAPPVEQSPAAPEPVEAPPPVDDVPVAPAMGEPKPVPAWKVRAREVATEWLAQRHAAGCWPSQRDVADWVARVLRGEGVMSPTGKPLTPDYIRRHALDKSTQANASRVGQMAQTAQPGKHEPACPKNVQH